MKPLLLLLLTLILASAAFAQVTPLQNVPIQHVIVVVQENRTIDNLFANDPNLSGVHFAPTGKCGTQTITLTPYQLDACFDASHAHTAWVTSYDSGNMDGFCQIPSGISHCTAQQQVGIPTCVVNGATVKCPQYTTVNASQIDQYFQIAKNGGFANYMFQTNQGPSFPAHQFLFTGTSAPIAPTMPFYRFFAAENATFPMGDTDHHNGCLADVGTFVKEVDPTTGAESKGFTPTYVDPADQTAGYPCYNHNTMVDVLNRAATPITWKYYTTGTNLPNDGSLWNAPNAIFSLCVPSGSTTTGSSTCTGSVYNSNVVNNLQLFTDLGANPSSPQCTLPQVSWVIPSGAWSDHPGTVGSDGGPSWVAAIVNAVGGFNNDGTPLSAQCGYFGNTVILTTWDDWGGYYDDVNPIAMSSGNGGSLGYPGTSNGTFYVYGFRVPLLVTSTFAKPNYVSGGGVFPPVCPNKYCHDFGSILNFIEFAFGSGGNSLGEICLGCGGGWHYDDFFAQDQGTAGFSLHDFFDFQKRNPFVQVTGAKYPTSCFLSQAAAEGCFTTFPTDPTDSD
ncbi:MAG TPA: alkaline phosphatase family protein [Candidatus Angelobacter sp.]|nr:alkaline phosphatase family protein [Candidatus Angelobacter sp.]